MDSLDGVPRRSYEPDPVLSGINRAADTNRRVNVLERAAPQRSSSISQNGRKRIGLGPLSSDGSKYGIEIFDDAGAVQARLGELTSQPGVYGLEVLVGNGRYVPVASIASGPNRQTVAGKYEQTVATGQNTGWQNIGPVITTTTASGKIEVSTGGSLVVAGNKCTVMYSYSIINAVTGSVVVQPDQFQGIRCVHNGYGMDNSQSGELTLTHQLDPGRYRVNGLFQIYGSAGMESTGSISNRTLGVQGY